MDEGAALMGGCQSAAGFAPDTLRGAAPKMPPVHGWHLFKREKSDAYLMLNNDVKAYFFFTKTEPCACFVDRSNKHCNRSSEA